MKKPVTVITNDWHIKLNNLDKIIELTKQIIKYTLGLNLKSVFILGDVFQSRQAQPLASLKCFEEALDLFKEAGITVYIIPGNHDKTDYKSFDSFLDSFTWHPALKLMRSFQLINVNGMNFRCIPYFSDELWMSQYNTSLKINPVYGKEAFLSHRSVNGSINNDGGKVEESISPSLFKKHEVTFLGHYHNYQKVSGEVYHLPSISQNDYSENDNKGLTVVYDDFTFDIVKLNFKRYETIEVNIDKVGQEGLKQVLKSLHPEETNIRIKLTGAEEKVNAIKIDDIKALGFSVKTERNDITASIKAVESGEIVEFTESSIVEEFKEFCGKEEYVNTELGLKYLNKKLHG